MSDSINIYCDESCHLLNDGHQVMTLGALWCPAQKRQEISIRLREIKARHRISPTAEVKWVKVSPSKVDFYQDWIDYFFDDDDLHFRGVVIPDKSVLAHDTFGQTHDDWYYKMLFTMLKVVLNDKKRHHIYIDLKDTHSAKKAQKLHEVLCNSAYDFDKSIIERVQPVRSHEIEPLQLCDLLIGAVGYANRGLATSTAKTQIIQRIRERSHLSLTRNTLLRATKLNLLIWEGAKNG